uniref:Uncharacterized protein n=1 Tax=Heterorhabditis bacteriophora TaxID=37862 RepID=A0A1I7WRZ6_HETBA
MPSPGLVKCVSLMTTTFGAHPIVAKTYINLFKQDHAMILSSEFGFLVMIAMCGIERYKSVTLTEMKRVFVKLWKFRDELSEFGWLSGTEVGVTMKMVEEQTENLLSRLSDDSSWKFFGYPLISLAQSLLDSPSSKDVIVVDGRVASGCSLWIFASEVLVKKKLVASFF